MTIAALNTFEARNRNLAEVLEAIRDAPGRSRSEIHADMPFSLQTMTNVVQELVDLGLVGETEKRRPGHRGSPHRGLHITAGGCHVLGLQMRWNACASALVDLNLDVIVRQTKNLRAPVEDDEAYIAELEQTIGGLLEQHSHRRIWALAVSAPLPIHERGAQQPLVPPQGNQWDDQRWFRSFWSRFSIESLRGRLQRTFGLPVLIQNNPQSAAMAEAMRLPRSARLVFLFAGLGFGAAFVGGRALNRDIWRHGGEIGHVVYRKRPLSSVLSASGVRMAPNLTQPQGTFEAELERLVTERPDLFEPWLEEAEPVLRFLVNFLENAIWPDGIALGGFLPNALIDRLLARVQLDDSMVQPDSPERSIARLFRARNAIEAIPAGVASTALSFRANPDFPALIGLHRNRD